jgi:cob(I)alamin adenosyltransferase
MKIYTRTGDTGDTGLFGGGRVPKSHVRVAAYGDVDELNSAIGVARATAPIDLFDAELEAIQRDLFAIGGHLATPDPDKVRAALAKAELSDARIGAFERLIDDADRELPPLAAFVLPAGAPKAAALHLARTICRRAERTVVALAREGEVPPLFLVYLNRLSDLLFMLSRLANHRDGRRDVTW